jgi:hypothetical protein
LSSIFLSWILSSDLCCLVSPFIRLNNAPSISHIQHVIATISNIAHTQKHQVTSQYIPVALSTGVQVA